MSDNKRAYEVMADQFMQSFPSIEKEKVVALLKFHEDFVINYFIVELLKHKAINEDISEVISIIAESFSKTNPFIKMQHGIRYKLAEIEHNQWIAWSKAVAGDVSEDRRERWEKFWVPFDKLSDDVKSFDYVWADRIMVLMDAFVRKEKMESFSFLIGDLKRAMDLYDVGQFDSSDYEFFKNSVMHELLLSSQDNERGI